MGAGRRQVPDNKSAPAPATVALAGSNPVQLKSICFVTMATPTQVKFAETNYGGAVTVSVIDVEAHSPGQQYLAADAQDAGPEIVLPPPLEPTQPPQNDASPAHNATSAGTRRSVRRSSSWLVKSRRRRPWKRLIRRELNWVTRYTMSGLLLAATPLMLGHFFYYMGLEGELVGDSFTQQKTRLYVLVLPAM